MNIQISPRSKRSRFLQQEDGNISVEFAILLPAIFLVCLSIAAICMYFATLSDVQQLATDMTRLSLTYVDRAIPIDDICLALQSDLMPRLVEGMPFVTVDRISGVSCQTELDRSTIAVMVNYDMTHTIAHRLGSLIGFTVSNLSGSAEMVL